MKKMAKKDLNEDIFSGGSISDSDKSDKSAKKAERLAKKSKKAAERNAAKKEKIDSEIKALKAELAEKTDEKEKAAVEKKLEKAKDKLAALNGKKSRVAAKQARIIKSVVAAVVIVALLVAYVGTGAVRHGFIHSTLQWTTHLTAATVELDNGEKIKVPVSTFNYYFAMTYNNMMSTQSTYEQYGLDLAENNLDVDFDRPLSKQTTTNDDDEVVTWLEYMYEQALESIRVTYTYYYEAVEANGGEEPEITDEQKSELEETISGYKDTANGYGYTTSGYLVQAMGKGVTESVFREEMTKSYIAQNYQTELSEDLSEKEYTDEDYTAYKDSHSDELQAVSIRIFEANSEDEAKAFYDALKSNGSNFTDLCVEYAEDGAYKSYYAQDEASTKLYATKSVLQAKGYAIATAEEHTHEEGEEHSEDEVLEYPGLDWLFSSDRKAGDKYQYSTTVVYVLEPASLPEESSVNVRHILVTPETDSENTDAMSATDEQWAAALDKAESIVDEFNKTSKTEDDFASLVSKYTQDTGSASTGGLYENIIPGQMVDSFETWSLDSSRKAGDVGIVQTEYGYHIMYFVGDTGTPIWKANAQQILASEDSSTAIEEIEDSSTAKMNWFGKFYIEKDTDIDA